MISALSKASTASRQYRSDFFDKAVLPSIQRLDGADRLPASSNHDRTVSPAQTIGNLRPHFQRLGITRLGDLTGLDIVGIPVAFASRPNSFSLSVNLGKGVDKDSAFASAAMEATEVAVAERPPNKCLRSSIKELLAHGISIVDLTRIARCQPERLDLNKRLEWIEGFDIISGRAIWVPWELVGLDCRTRPVKHNDAFEISTDGLASGNVAAEAVFHGICELIERDAHALLELLSQDALRERLCDPEDFRSETLANLKQLVKQAGLAFRLLDMTTDIQVPAFMALLMSSRVDEDAAIASPNLYVGCGCHVSPQRAIIRALTEASQARVALVAGARDDFQAKFYQTADRLQPFTTWQNPFPARSPHRLKPDFGSLSSRAPLGILIENVATKLMAVGIEQIIVVKLDCEISRISVVRVVIPDLQIPLHGTRTQITSRGLARLLEYRQ